VPAGTLTVPVDEKKKATAVKATANEPTATVNEKKKATASIDQPAINKTVKAPEPI
jgi:hypothetical protein